MTQTTNLHRKLGERFVDNDGDALNGGKLYYYRAGTTTLLDTYSEQTGVTANTNPLVLNAAGRLEAAVYIGPSYDYKELLTDSDDNTIDPWPMDNIPAAVDPAAGQTGFALPLVPWLVYTSASSPVTVTTSLSGYGFEADTSGGSVTFNLPSAASVGAGKILWFKKIASANTVSVSPNGTDTIDGANADYTLSAAYQLIGLASDGAGWQIISNVIFLPQKPQGRLTLTTGTPIIAANTTAKDTIYYTAYEGNTIPIWNGATFVPVSFSSDLSLTLTAAAGASAIVDVFAINQSGVATLGFGPSWSSATPGSCSRGTGAGTTELELVSGIWTNKNTITLTNGVTTYASIAANEATYLGSVFIDGSAGQTSCYVAAAQNAKYGLWNAYNRLPVVVQAADATASWTYGTNAWRVSNNDTNNALYIFTGLAEETAKAAFVQYLSVSGSSIVLAEIGIGVNSTTTASGKQGAVKMQQGAANTGSDAHAIVNIAPTLGINKLTCLEYVSGSTNVTFNGSPTMLLQASYRA